MTLSTERASMPAASLRRLTRVLHVYVFCGEFVLLYPLYALFFQDTGLSVWQISSLFALWSGTVVVLEVPSGVWADAVSRRASLVLGPLSTAAGFASWVLVPSYGAFALGFVLWGVGGALCSGALQALVHDELDHAGAADRYARVMGRARSVGLMAVMAAMALAGPVFSWGGYPAVGAASVLVCLVGAAVATLFPEHRRPSPEAARGWVGPLRAGFAEARSDRSVRAALLLVPAVGAIWGALDEYTPLLAGETGVAHADVPWVLLVVWAGAAVGGLLAGSAERMGPKGLAGLLVGSALALAAGGAAGTPGALVLVAVAFGGFQLAEVLADARLQSRIEDTGRATLTSVAGLGTQVATLAVFAAYAATAATTGHGAAFAWAALPYLLVALLPVVDARRDGPGRVGPDASAP
ncbi:MFS transporter [Streptomyces sp. ZYX-F-203]